VKAVEWTLLALFALLMLIVVLWPVMPYVISWLYLFNSWRFPGWS